MTKHYPHLVDHYRCTGCGICTIVCPNRCIRMREGYIGHLFPTIDRKLCIKCGLCVQACPAIHPPVLSSIACAFASWSKDNKDYRTSASGGIATELSKHFVRNGGVVYGCALFPGVYVRHIRVDKIEDLERLKSSKYVQSSIIEVIPAIKKDVADGKSVLFVGTPCQVAAVKALYKQQPESLYFVDLICHGVPSLKLLNKYIHSVSPDKNCTNVTFRDGNSYSLRLWDNESLVFEMPYRSPRFRGIYLDAFMDGYTFRDSCYDCPYAGSKRVGDITLGDFWGLGQTLPVDEIADHPYGCSVILPTTKKGLYLVEVVRKNIELYPRTIEEAIKGNAQLQRPTRMNKRIRFYRRIQRFVSWPSLYRWINIDRVITGFTKGC